MTFIVQKIMTVENLQIDSVLMINFYENYVVT